MEQYIVQKYFKSVKRNKYLYQHSTPRVHLFSGMKASIANKASVALGGVRIDEVDYFILSVTWTKPHFFIINSQNSDTLWIEGDCSGEIRFNKLYSTITSLSNWVQTIRTLAVDGLLVKWAQCGQFVKASSAKKKLAQLTPVQCVMTVVVTEKPPEDPPMEPPIDEPDVEYAIALYDYVGDSDLQQLDLKKGDKIEVIKKTDSGWWTGILNGKKGLFPINFVQVQ